MIPGLSLFLGAALASQPVGYQAETDVILRVIDVRVTDKQDAFVPNLTSDLFRVWEDGESREIETFERQACLRHT